MVALIAGLLVFDLSVQGIQLSNQSAIYALDPVRPQQADHRSVRRFLTGR